MPKLHIKRFYYRNGQIHTENRTVAGNFHGACRVWHRNGQLAEEMRYRDGLMHGVSREWDENGRLLGSFTMVNGSGSLRFVVVHCPQQILEDRHLGIELLSKGRGKGHGYNLHRVPELLGTDTEAVQRLIGGEVGLSGPKELLDDGPEILRGMTYKPSFAFAIFMRFDILNQLLEFLATRLGSVFLIGRCNGLLDFWRPAVICSRSLAGI